MTIEEQRRLFRQTTPMDFIQLYFDRQDQGEVELPIFKYVAIKCREKIHLKLTENEVAFRKKYQKEFGNLDISDFLPSYYWTQPELPAHHFATKVVSSVRANIIQSNSPNEKNITGICELLKAVEENIGFSKNDIPTKRLRPGMCNFKEASDAISSFTGKKYELGMIAIRLSPKAFTHILVGHVSKYVIPRKGYQVLFERIHTWQDLLDFIDFVINLTAPNIIEHFSQSQNEFDKTDIVIDGIGYGIHIDRNGDIKTFYQKVVTS